MGLHPEVRERLREPAARLLDVMLGVAATETQERRRRRRVLARDNLPILAKGTHLRAPGEHDLELPRLLGVGCIRRLRACVRRLRELPSLFRGRIAPSAPGRRSLPNGKPPLTPIAHTSQKVLSPTLNRGAGG